MPENDELLLSPTQINMALRCGAQYEFRYVQGLKIPPAVSMTIGSGCDTAATRDLQTKMTCGELAEEDILLDLARDTTKSYFDRDEVVLDEDEQKRAQVVFLSSRSAERSLPNLSIYSASKGSIEKLCESLRVEYAPFRIAFTVINPGSINTAFTKDWTREAREAHNAEAMLVGESITPITDAIDSCFSVNKVSYESMQQWINEPVTVKLWK